LARARKTGVAGSVEDHRRPRNLDDGPSPPPSLERMKRNGRDGVPLATVSDNQPRDGDHGGKKVSLGGTVM